MREIIFRGKDKFDGEWYVGSLSHDTKYGNCFIEVSVHQGIAKEVIPETVGQYTGLTDKNGTKIFEGDILLWHSEWGEDFITVVEWDNKRAYFGARESGFDIPPFEIDDDFSKVEIIGNVHDNPELLNE